MIYFFLNHFLFEAFLLKCRMNKDYVVSKTLIRCFYWPIYEQITPLPIRQIVSIIKLHFSLAKYFADKYH